MQEMPDEPRPRLAGSRTPALPPKRRSTIADSWPRAPRAPRRRTRGPSGSTRKKGPSPNRSLPGSGRIKQDVHRAARIVDSTSAWAKSSRNRRRAACAAPRGRKKWVSHGLSNRDRLRRPALRRAAGCPMAVLNAHQPRRQQPRGDLPHADQGGHARQLPARRSASRRRRPTRSRARQFFEYGRHTIDVWRLRSEAFVPRITTFEEDARVLARARRDGRGFLLVTGPRRQLGDGRRHAAPPRPRAGRRRPARSSTRTSRRCASSCASALGVESIDIGSSMATAFKVRAAVDRGPRRRAARRPRLSRGPGHRAVLRTADAVPALARAARALLRLRRSFPASSCATPTASYFNVWGEPLDGRLRRSRRTRTPSAS